MSNYQEQAARTMSDQFHSDKVSLEWLVTQISASANYSQLLDTTKKALFYGKAMDKGFYVYEHPISDEHLSRIHADRQTAINILHCAIGMATEAGELLEALYKALHDGEQLDVVNLAEEVGDSQWYAANLATALGTTLDAIQDTNIAKLQTRYPDKFTSDHALNRDLFEERKVLEG